MFKRVLVPVDLSEKSAAAVAVACDLAAGSAGEIILLHVIETIEHVDFDELRSFYHRLESKAMAMLRRLADQAAQKQVRARTEIVYGKRARSIIDFAMTQGIDLIVLRSHRVEPGAGFASISYEVGVLSPCAVLLLK